MKTRLMLIAVLSTALMFPPKASATELYVLTSISESRSYGLMLTAPPEGCGRVRYSVRGPNGFLGQTPPLSPGEGALVRMGRGFVPGNHVLSITRTGCKSGPAKARRVVLAKSSPDHGWRWPN